MELSGKGKERLLQFLLDYFEQRTLSTLRELEAITLSGGDSIDIEIDLHIKIAEDSDPDDPEFSLVEECTETAPRQLH